MAAQKPWTIDQNVIDAPVDSIVVRNIAISQLTLDILQESLPPPKSGQFRVGLAQGYTNTGKLSVLVVVVESNALLINMSGSTKKGTLTAGAQILEDFILTNPEVGIVAFDLTRLALSLYDDRGLHTTGGVDLLTAVPIGGHDGAVHAIQFAVGGQYEIWQENVENTFANLLYSDDKRDGMHLVSRAWCAYFISGLGTMEDILYDCKKIDTAMFPPEILSSIAQQSGDTIRAELQIPGAQSHDTTITWNDKKQNLSIKSNRFQTRLRGSGQNLKVEAVSSLGRFTVTGENLDTSGRTSTVKTTTNLNGLELNTVSSVGRDALTSADVAKLQTIRKLLQGDSALSSPFHQAIYVSSTDSVEWPTAWSDSDSPPIPIVQDEAQPLNISQEEAVTAMLDIASSSHLCLVQGPPGTGKTSVIARFVLSAIEGGRKGIWLLAQSNVAVKNIGEKLLKIGFTKFRLLLSRDFYEEWHEHLYGRGLSHYTILSRDFKPANVQKEMQGIQVLLCTVSMLSHPNIHRFTKLCPLVTLVIDEASQISLGEYLSILDRQSKNLHKMVFIGDDKQLPPFGDKEMKSIFEVSHLRSEALFLNTQYRMPPQIGDFISSAVYDSQLLSFEGHPITSKTPSIHFVDVPEGKGITPPEGGTSFINVKEAETILLVARKFQEEGHNFRIITPYDSQRTLMEGKLKEAGLDWGDKVFNVDSFQGNEEDYILISIVRHMGLGFLSDRRRTNVMLSRCKRGMYIFTSERYLQEGGKESLVAEMAEKFGEQAWISVKDIEGGNF